MYWLGSYLKILTSAINSFASNKIICSSKYPHWFSHKLIKLLKLKENFHRKQNKSPSKLTQVIFSRLGKLWKKTVLIDQKASKRNIESDLDSNTEFHVMCKLVSTSYIFEIKNCKF